ncbi:MAG: PEGA domain-containing protein [Myxococcota bacterium]|nr:PEGA domain-containing protein [Myxococcota bacterium]
MRILFLLALFFTKISLADDKVAVFDFESEGYLQLRTQLEEEARSGLLLATVERDFFILSPENVLGLMQDVEQEFSCSQQPCEIDIARTIGVDYFITGNLARLEGVMVLDLQLFSGKDGTVLGSRRIEGAQPLSLVRQTSGAAQDLFGDFLAIEKRQSSAESLEESFILSIETTPSDAIVLVDDSLFCDTTPCSKEIPAGTHRVSIHKMQYYKVEKEIELQSNIELKETLGPKFAMIDVLSPVPNIHLHIDGKKIGKTPFYNYKISPGKHTLSINDPCYARQDIVLDAQEGNRESIQLAPVKRQVPLSIRVMDSFSNQYEAKLYVDGVSIGSSPFEGTVSKCAKSVKMVLADDEHTYEESLSLSLKDQENAIILSVPDLQADVSKRKVLFDFDFLFGKPIWYTPVGYRRSIHSAGSGHNFDLNSGYIQPGNGSGYQGAISDYSIPADLFLNETALVGIGAGIAANIKHAFFRFNIDYETSGEAYYYSPNEGTGFPLMVYSPDLLNISVSAGWMPMTRLLRPWAGVQVQGSIYSMDIIEVDEESELMQSYTIYPYYLVSTDYSEEGDPIRPRFQLGAVGVGPSVGAVFYIPGPDFITGVEVSYSYIFTTSTSFSQFQASVIFGNLF